MDFADHNPGPHLHTGAPGCGQQDFVQLQSRQGARSRHIFVAEQELVFDDQFAVGVEDAHAVIAESGRQNFRQHPERLVDAERIRRLPEPDARHVEGRPPLDENDFNAALRQSRSSRQATHAAANHQDAPNVAHGRQLAVAR